LAELNELLVRNADVERADRVISDWGTALGVAWDSEYRKAQDTGG
jgi:hypothetical protein